MANYALGTLFQKGEKTKAFSILARAFHFVNGRLNSNLNKKVEKRNLLLTYAE